ncbi:MAG: B12-binding domain-containing radical SAM protein [Hyphomicrobiales bacterium]|nr:B12-binding domain-containing radical SAM protein [Hyphomicrobiales bacterium]
MTNVPCNVLLVYPNFDFASFWDFRATCEIAGKKATLPPLGMITIAALFPDEWVVRLIDRNIEPLSDADIDWADLVLTGGMIPQRADALTVIERCQARGKPVVVGGPDVTSSPEVFEKAEFRVLGEAETTIAELVAAWNAGEKGGKFAAERYATDIRESPVPRFDLLRVDDYISLGVQFSRGCPFTCEFCDIIELYGRVPRTKASEQILAELDAIYATGYRGTVFFVDDNLIGNKKAVKAFLPHLRAWLEERGFPFDFVTEASINLADDAELLNLLRDTNFGSVFIGIETPDEETLVSTSKKQNVRRSLSESVDRIIDAGIFVSAGFIIGFDGEKESVADGMIRCIEENAIPLAMVGLLTALPETQLTRRLTRESRLDPASDMVFDGARGGDQCMAGLNFRTSRPRRDILDDHRKILVRIYDREAYFNRVRALSRRLNRPKLPTKIHWRLVLTDTRTFLRLTWRMTVVDRKTGKLFFRNLADCLWNNPLAAKAIVSHMMLYLHLGPFSEQVIAHLEREIAALDADDRLDTSDVAA